MTDPTEPVPSDQSQDVDGPTLDRLRAMLRDEPVQDDELARERRIRIALAAADPVSTVPVPRRRPATPWLVAAAVIAVVGVGSALLVNVSGSGGGQDESADVATAGAGSSTDADAAPPDDGSPSDGQDAVTTTMGSAELAPADLPVADLGDFPDVAALRDAAAASATGTTSRAGDESAVRAATLPCVAQQRALGVVVVGVGSVGGELIVVVRSPSGTELLSAATCTTMPD